MKQYKHLFFGLALVAITLVSCKTKETVLEKTTLKDAYADSFKMGCAISPFITSGRSQQAVDLLLQHFNTTTPDNCLKPEVVHPKPDVWNFKSGDEYVKFGQEHNMFIVGHTFLWHNQTPDFFWYKENGQKKSDAELIETLRAYIEVVAGRYSGKIHAWDVANEVVAEEGGFRDVGWMKVYDGDDYDLIKSAFTFAHQYAPDAELYYNDYNVWRPTKVDGVVALIKRLQADGVKIDGVGVQAHWGLDYPDNKYIEHTLDTLSTLGIKVMITELDVDVLPFTKDGMVIGKVMNDIQFQREEWKKALDPYKEGLPADVEERLNKRYEEIFEILYARRDFIDRVTFWGLTDGHSWKNGSPIPRRTNYPHLFNRDYTAKAGLNSVLAIPQREK